MYDLIIRGGTVVDGTGAPSRLADVAVSAGRIAAVGDDLGRAKREVDADGMLVSPGWVDIHTHYDGQATWDPLCSPAANHGITTLVMGNCGIGFAPCEPDEAAHDRLIAVVEGDGDLERHATQRWQARAIAWHDG